MSTFTATSADMDGYISYSTNQGGGTTAPAINNGVIRLYQNNNGDAGGNITIAAKPGATITAVTIGSDMDTQIKWEVNGTVDASTTELKKGSQVTISDLSASAVTCHCYGADKSHRLYVNYLKIIYAASETPGEGGGETPEPTPDPEEPGDDVTGNPAATIAAGTNGSACTVNGKDGIKVGTSKLGGNMTITVPANATALQFYAAAWNKVTGLSINITPADKVATTSIELTADAGIANSTPFTLSGEEASFYYEVALNNITEETTLTVATEKRFVIWGVTYTAGSNEGGETPETPSLAAPTFSLAAGTYTEAQEVSLAAAEGTIYYTLDGTTPTAESEEYTEAIVLDECGTTTIKAIAISGENSSSVATATYKLQLPIPANDAKNPYTAEEAIEVYDGGCYAGQNVYVTGVVTSASYNSTYGNYTITLKGGFQFYRFQETAENKFTEDYITPGDTLVACGKLDKYNSNYQLAQGCYLVEHKAYSAPKVDISNTKETAYTVEEAIALIDNITSDLTKKVYVKGIVSEIVTPLDANYGNITYNISTDGSKSAPQFQLYRGKSYEGEKFTSEDEIKVGDKVIIYGEMTKYGSTYEMLANNQLVALERESDGTTTGLDNITIDTNITKTIVNGQLIIIKNGVKYNVAGAVVK